MGLIGNLIKSERINQSMKQNVLAKGICSPSYLCKIENNQVEPSIEILQLLFNRLNLTIDLINTSTINNQNYRDELFYIYQEVIQKRTISYTKEKLTYLRDNQSNYLSKDLFFTFKLIELYLLLIIVKDPKDVELHIAIISKNEKNFDREQAYLYEKCLGIYYYKSNQLSAASEALHKALENLPIGPFGNYEKADLTYMSALTKLASNQFIQSIEFLEYPKDFFMNNVNFPRIIECLLIEGIANQKLKNLEKARDIYIKALRMTENTMPNTSIAVIYQNLGSVNSSLGYLEESLDYYFKSYELKATHEQQLITILSIIQIYSKLENYTAMETWINQGLALVENREIFKPYYYHFKMYHHLFIQFGDLKFINKALNYFEHVNDSRHVYKYGLKIAELFKQQQKYKLAAHYYKRATFNNNQSVRYWEDL